ncbi:hypothetical protein R1sor_022789 [Riccia sorocarpa]|uniref:Uncharacterized protein n=1 Tax=Riccia sorocarpa TaxID=122646 RepID=A0ABD3GKX8_9MARC
MDEADLSSTDEAIVLAFMAEKVYVVNTAKANLEDPMRRYTKYVNQRCRDVQIIKGIEDELEPSESGTCSECQGVNWGPGQEARDPPGSELAQDPAEEAPGSQ